jgi:hypothetical protein
VWQTPEEVGRSALAGLSRADRLVSSAIVVWVQQPNHSGRSPRVLRLSAALGPFSTQRTFAHPFDSPCYPT